MVRTSESRGRRRALSRYYIYMYYTTIERDSGKPFYCLFAILSSHQNTIPQDDLTFIQSYSRLLNIYIYMTIYGNRSTYSIEIYTNTPPCTFCCSFLLSETRDLGGSKERVLSGPFTYKYIDISQVLCCNVSFFFYIHGREIQAIVPL